jgi:hypothetical protein
MKNWNEDKELRNAVKTYLNYSSESVDAEMAELGIPRNLPFSNDMSMLNNFNLSGFSYEKTKKNMLRLFPDYDMKNFYRLNSTKLRSDEFRREHRGMHVLFAGCSITAGEGIPEELLWTRKVYEKISQDQGMSGYFNIAFPGATIAESVIQVFKYIKAYGNPHVIFLNLPDINREYVNLSSADMMDISQNPIDNVSVEKINYLVVGIFLALSEYCKTNSIELYAFSWSTPDAARAYKHFDSDPRDFFENFYSFEEPELGEHCHKYAMLNKKDVWHKYHYEALDESHAGIALQDFYYNFIYNVYITKTNLKQGLTECRN